MKVTEKFVLFWGSEFSNWYLTDFVFKNIEFTSAEQAMMYMKAKTFGDSETAQQILNTNNPKTQKALGRMVKNFDVNIWNAVALDIVTDIVYAKFTQSEKLTNLILSYPDKEFVEASPYDKIWGIGLHFDDDNACDKSKWQGTNWLGMALTMVRDIIQAKVNGK